MKFLKLAEIAANHKKIAMESAFTVLDFIKIYPCDTTEEHAGEMYRVASLRREAYEWYKREQKARRQAEKAGEVK